MGQSAAILIVLIGAPGTGKTYLGARLAARLDALMVQTDAIRKRRFPQPAYSHSESAQVYAAAHRKIEACLRARRTVVFDATNLRESYRRTLYAIAEQARAELRLLWLSSSESVVARRLRRRQVAPDPGDLSDATWPIFRQLASTAEPPTREFVVLNGTTPVEDLLRVLARVLDLRGPPYRSENG